MMTVQIFEPCDRGHYVTTACTQIWSHRGGTEDIGYQFVSMSAFGTRADVDRALLEFRWRRREAWRETQFGWEAKLRKR